MSKISFILLPMGTFHKKRETKWSKNFPVGCVGKFYRNLADNVNYDLLGSDLYGSIANDYDIPSDDVRKYILATKDFAKGIQTLIIAWRKIWNFQ